MLKPWSLSNTKPLPGLSGVPVVLVTLNKLPVPSSLMVAIPALPELITLVVPSVLAATSLKVSLLSKVLSLVIATRTNIVAPVVGICTKLPAV